MTVLLSSSSGYSSIATETTKNLTYYVTTTGSDSNPGTLENPFATIQKALDTIPPTIKHSVVINIGDGDYLQTVTSSHRVTSSGSLTVNGGIAVESFGPYTISSRSGRRLNVSGVTWQSDDYKCRFIKVTSGPNINKLFPVASSGTNWLEIAGEFSLDGGTTFSFAGPSVSIQSPSASSNPMVVLINGGHDIANTQQQTYSSAYDDSYQNNRVIFKNIRFSSADGTLRTVLYQTGYRAEFVECQFWVDATGPTAFSSPYILIENVRYDGSKFTRCLFTDIKPSYSIETALQLQKAVTIIQLRNAYSILNTSAVVGIINSPSYWMYTNVIPYAPPVSFRSLIGAKCDQTSDLLIQNSYIKDMCPGDLTFLPPPSYVPTLSSGVQMDGGAHVILRSSYVKVNGSGIIINRNIFTPLAVDMENEPNGSIVFSSSNNSISDNNDHGIDLYAAKGFSIETRPEASVQVIFSTNTGDGIKIDACANCRVSLLNGSEISSSGQYGIEFIDGNSNRNNMIYVGSTVVMSGHEEYADFQLDGATPLMLADLRLDADKTVVDTTRFNSISTD